ncbi:WbqC family protein [Pseudomonas japonica]|uniref:WbqC-like protein family protein n=1 Tax=Pseudomonas japonica TaxID=256466 RepID=A0A239B0Y1_9PSED|nr:WbqC family protein [Pseudomonas japonica]SNS01271.1 WbqC-like protein family protein [Pseudomonas japonica]
MGREKSIAILQSNYIPWKGYVDMIACVDEFIFYDEMQYTKNDWRNRNKIKTPQGLQWLSVPVGGAIHRRICDVTVSDSRWAVRHWNTLEANYRRSPFFDEISGWLRPLYTSGLDNLSEINQALLGAICNYLGISTRLSRSTDYVLEGDKTERLINLCKQAGATEYVTGGAARAYLEEGLFAREGIKVTYFDYSGYPDYAQLWGDFVHEVSVLDLLFNCGPNAATYMKFVQK